MSYNYPDQDEWFEEQLLPHEPMLRAWLTSSYGDQIDVDDVIQDAFIRVLAAKDKQELKSPKAYFFAVARNLAVDSIRKSKVISSGSYQGGEVMGILDESICIEEEVARNYELELLTQAIQSLPNRCRQIFTLSKVYGMTYNEIAEEMGISFHTVSAQVSIGLRKCAKFMRQHGRS